MRWAWASRRSISLLLRGTPIWKVAMLAFTCSRSDMPERIMVTLGMDCRNRKAQAGMGSSGRMALRGAASSSERRARRPPRRGSMTQTGICQLSSSSTFSRPFWKVQSM